VRVVPGVIFAMRYPDDIGFVWNNIARLYDIVAGSIQPRTRCLVAYPKLTGTPAFVAEVLTPVQADFYDTSSANRPRLATIIEQRQIKTIVYMGCEPSTIDLGWLRSQGVRTASYEQESFSPDATQPAWKRTMKRIVRGHLKQNIHDLYLANAHHQRRFLLDFAGLPPTRVVTVVNGVDADYFCPGDAPAPEALGLPRTDLYALSVCQARPEKRLEFLLDVAADVFARAPDLSLTFVHVGAGEVLDRCRAKAADFGLTDRFCFAGFHNDVRPFHRLSSFLVHAAERESFGLVIAESMACGKPAIATDSAGPSEIIVNGQTGRLVGKDDREAFAAAVIDLATDAGRRDAWGTAARKRAWDRFSLRRQAEEFRLALTERGLC